MVRILIRFNEDQVSEPIASQIIIEYKVPMAILSAHINSKGGEILAEVPDDILEKVVNAFRERGVTVTVPKLIEVDSRQMLQLRQLRCTLPSGSHKLSRRLHSAV